MKKKSKSRWNWVRSSASPLLALVLLGAVHEGSAQQQLESQFRLNGKEVAKAFKPIQEVLQQSSAVIYDGRTSIVYGVVVSPDGYILTKASELENAEDLTIRINKSRFTELKILATTADWDVALIKVDAQDLVPVNWIEEGEPSHGTWVVSNGASTRYIRRVRVGVVSANARQVGGGRSAVVLGVNLDRNEKEQQLSIKEVQKDSGAEEAGLAAGDIIRSVDGQEVKAVEDLQKILSDKNPGDKITMRVKRGEEEKDFEVELRAREKIFKETRTRNDQMSGRFSKRRTNFKRILQHDTNLSKRTVGGPLLDLEGRCLGMNIARVNRCENFALPAKEVQEVFAELLKEANGGGESGEETVDVEASEEAPEEGEQSAVPEEE